MVEEWNLPLRGGVKCKDVGAAPALSALATPSGLLYQAELSASPPFPPPGRPQLV